ncbi:38336_t:CDS:1, partial [Gigaspora margarita]
MDIVVNNGDVLQLIIQSIVFNISFAQNTSLLMYKNAFLGKKKHAYTCGICGKDGHHRSTCSNK